MVTLPFAFKLLGKPLRINILTYLVLSKHIYINIKPFTCSVLHGVVQDRRKEHCSRKCELTQCPCSLSLVRGIIGPSNHYLSHLKNRRFNELFHLAFVFCGKNRPALSSHTVVLKITLAD